MGALQRYDEWVSALDLTESSDLSDVYDPATLAAIDARVEPSGAASNPWRGGLAAGALVAGMANGIKDALDVEEGEAVVEVDEARPERHLEPVSVYLAWGTPAASVAIVRPWLF